MALRFSNFGIGVGGRLLFSGLEALLKNGENLAILGCNGVGKSSFLRSLAGLHKEILGEIHNDFKTFSYLPQNPEIRKDIPTSIADFVGFAKIINPKISNKDVFNAIEKFQLCDIAKQNIGCVSGGQLILAQLARIEMEQSELIILDEPFASLDKEKSDILLLALKAWKDEGRSVIVSIHDESISKDFDHFLTLDGTKPLWENRQPRHKHNCEYAHREINSPLLVAQ